MKIKKESALWYRAEYKYKCLKAVGRVVFLIRKLHTRAESTGEPFEFCQSSRDQ